MLVVLDMLGAVAVIAVALGAVSELHVGKLSVSFAADGALVDVALFLVSLRRGLLEVDSLRGMPVLVALAAVVNGFSDVGPEEDEEVENGHQWHESPYPKAEHHISDHIPGKECRIDPGQPFYFHRQDEHEQNLHIRVENGEGEEHGHIDIADGGDTKNQSINDIEDYPSKEEAVEPGGTPLPFQQRADPVIEISRQYCHKERCAGDCKIKDTEIAGNGDKNKGDEPPDLPPEDGTAGKVEGGGEGIAAKPVNEPDGHVGYGDVEHQVGDTEPGMLRAKFVYPLLDGTQGGSLLEE